MQNQLHLEASYIINPSHQTCSMQLDLHPVKYGNDMGDSGGHITGSESPLKKHCLPHCSTRLADSKCQ